MKSDQTGKVIMVFIKPRGLNSIQKADQNRLTTEKSGADFFVFSHPVALNEGQGNLDKHKYVSSIYY